MSNFIIFVRGIFYKRWILLFLSVYIFSGLICTCSGNGNSISYKIELPDSIKVMSNLTSIIRKDSSIYKTNIYYEYYNTISGRTEVYCQDSLLSIGKMIGFSYSPDFNNIRLSSINNNQNNWTGIVHMDNYDVKFWSVPRIMKNFESQILDNICTSYEADNFWNYLFIYLVFFNQCKYYILGIFTLIVIVDLYRKRNLIN